MRQTCHSKLYLFQAFDQFWVLLLQKKQIEVSFLCVCPLIEDKGLNFFQALISLLLKLCVYL